MILVEPTVVYENRVRWKQEAPPNRVVRHQALTGFQKDIVQAISASDHTPMLIVRIVNEAVALQNYTSRRERVEAKIEVLKEIGRMIGQGKLLRVKRKFVRLASYTISK